MTLLRQSATLGATFLFGTALLTTNAEAVILDQSENFNDGSFADNAALAAAGYTFSDPAASGLDGEQPQGDPDGGDGLDDGGIFVDGLTIGGTVTYPFEGTIENGSLYRVGVNLFQSSNSFVEADLELLANGAVVASRLDFTPINGHSGRKKALPATLFFHGDASTAGQTLSFRMRQSRGVNGTFDVGIDNWELANIDLSTPIGNQFETFSGPAVPFGYVWPAETTKAGFFPDEFFPDSETAPSGDGVYPGDGADDGGIYANGNNGGPPTSLVEYRFDGVIEDGQQYNFGVHLYKPSLSDGESTVELITDPGGPSETVVASVFQDGIDENNPRLVELTYTGDASAAGKQLAFRVSSDGMAGGAGDSSDVGIDGWWLALASGLSGDFNANEVVDAADYAVWLGALGGDEAALNGNGDGSGAVDIGDYTLWKSNLGNSTGSGALTRSVVPEPNSLIVLLVVVTSLPIIVQCRVGDVAHKAKASVH